MNATAKKQKPGMSAFLAGATQPPPATAPKPVGPVPVVAEVKTEAPVKRGKGRPAKAEKTEVQMTTIRLDPDDHLQVRQLALRDHMPMNELVIVALREYCKKRGVKLSGA